MKRGNRVWSVNRRIALLSLLILTIPVDLCVSLRASTSKPTPAKADSTEQASQETTVLRAQLEVMRQYDQRLLNTVYWALGSVIFVALVLSGFSWYANFRIYERDRNSLKGELQLSVQQEMARLKQELQNSATQKFEELSAWQEEFLKDASSRYEAVSKTAREAADAVERRLSQGISRLRVDLIGLEIERQKAAGASPTTLLWSHIDKLEAALGLGWGFYIGDVLEGILPLIKKGGKLSAYKAKQLRGLLEKVPKDYEVHVESIRKSLPESVTE